MIRAELDAAHECDYAIMAQLSSIDVLVCWLRVRLPTGRGAYKTTARGMHKG